MKSFLREHYLAVIELIILAAVICIAVIAKVAFREALSVIVTYLLVFAGLNSWLKGRRKRGTG